MRIGTITRVDKKIIHISLIIVFGIIGYSDTFDYPFHFDDAQNIVENPLIQNTDYLFNISKYCSNVISLEDKHLCKFFRSRYIGYLTFALNHRVNGLDVRGYHVVNLFIHILNAFLIYSLIFLTFKTPILNENKFENNKENIALFAALFFIIHPVQTQAITYIVQRFTSLSVLFYLLSVVFYILWRINIYRYSEAPEKKNIYLFFSKKQIYCLLSVFFALLAMKTKEIAFTIPVVILLYEIIFLGRSKKTFLYVFPFIFTSLIILLDFITNGFQYLNLLSHIDNVTKLQTEMPRWSYFLTELRVIVTYIRLLIFPISQNLDYDYPIANSIIEPGIIFSILLIISIIFFGIFILDKYKNKYPCVRIISFGIFWFFITLSIESSFFPIVDVIFEHRLYLPSVGAFISISSGIFLFTNLYEQKWKYHAKRIVNIVLILLVIGLTITTYLRNKVWSSDIALWSDVVMKSPNKLRGYYNLAHAYQDANYLTQALEIYNKVINIDNNYRDAYYNMGNIYYSLRRYDKALEMYFKVTTLDNMDYQAYNNMGNVYLDIGDYNKALSNYNFALSINPLSDRIYNNRGRLFLRMKQYQKAVEDFTIAIYLNPNKASYFMNRGYAFCNSNNIPACYNDMKTACEKGNKDACDFYYSH